MELAWRTGDIFWRAAIASNVKRIPFLLIVRNCQNISPVGEAKLRISRTIWYTKWRRIYKDPNKEKRELANRKRETIKQLMKFE